MLSYGANIQFAASIVLMSLGWYWNWPEIVPLLWHRYSFFTHLVSIVKLTFSSVTSTLGYTDLIRLPHVTSGVSDNVYITLTACSIRGVQPDCVTSSIPDRWMQRKIAVDVSVWIGHVNEYPTMHHFGIPRHSQSMIAYKISGNSSEKIALWECC